MSRKSVVVSIGIGVLCLGLGVGGTLAAQKFIFNKLAISATVQAKPKVDGPLVPIGEFTINLQGGSYLKTSIALEGTDAKAEASLKAKDAFLKDRVNIVLSNKSAADVQTPAGMEKIRQELLKQLNEVADNKIQSVLFLSFVYQ
ncbi:MAG: flagellar basal body-associated FliL family protein [Desulfitobacteriaceae bacterium]